MKDVESLFRSFTYAFKGFFWILTHERNFRVHITCLTYMFYFLLRYDFFEVTRTQYAILLLASALVIGGEMINTGIEKADDSVSEERRETIAISKDVAAGAVLVFAIFAVLCGIAILYQPEAFNALFNHYAGNPLYLVTFVISIILSTIFIFKFDFRKKDNK